MTTTIPTFGPIAPSLHALRGIRFIEGPEGGAPAAGAGEPAGDPSPAPAGSEPTGAAPEGAEPTPKAGETVDSLPDWAQREIRNARKEAGDYRARAKAAADEAQRVKDQAAIALGLKQPDAPADPALVAAQTAAKQAATDLAVYRTASGLGANADRLMDSARFLENVRALDHTASDFTAQVQAVITAALTADPSLKTVRATGSSGPEAPAATGEQGLITEAQLAAATPEQIVEWDDKGLLKHLL